MLSPDSDNGSELSDEGYRSLNFITVNDRAPRHQAVPKHKSKLVQQLLRKNVKKRQFLHLFS